MGCDPDHAPDPAAWLALDEGERRDLMFDWHAHNPDPIHATTGPADLHAAMHQTVETQIAMGDPAATAETVARLTEAGVRRHVAIHLIIEVLMAHLSRTMQDGVPFDRDSYGADLAAISPADSLSRLIRNRVAREEVEASPPRNRAQRRAARKKKQE